MKESTESASSEEKELNFDDLVDEENEQKEHLQEQTKQPENDDLNFDDLDLGISKQEQKSEVVEPVKSVSTSPVDEELDELESTMRSLVDNFNILKQHIQNMSQDLIQVRHSVLSHFYHQLLS